MSNTPQVVDGEASESDSEIEIEIGKTPDAKTQDTTNTLASVISGEASESDDEDTLSPPVRHPSPPPPPLMSPAHHQIYCDSILHSRLWEVNVSMYRNVVTLKLHTLKLAYEKLASVNKELLALQESVRFADNQVTLARARSKQVKEQLRNCHFQTALPTLKIE